MRAFSLDLRERVLAGFQAGMTFAELGRKYSTSAEWVRQFIRRYQATGEIAARPPIPQRVPFHRRHEAELRKAVAEQPDLTLEALRAKLGLDVSIGALHNALKALKISFKKKRSSRPSGNGPTSRPSGTNSRRSKRSASTRTALFLSTKPGPKRT
jgi:transposase